ncbi:thiamine biosynthesis lipoprotein [Nonlabens sp. Hel1_33_55]|uniref:FAD:protein FMN transferase n=1 Tax=Nonlabens sp. Hel1_33_55 TaxID=1336802 RepID=UPI000875DF0C|nr:FAD:protein FMN transferase [Nonlabens sp. Hel1_33_55]SCY25767.1 thiamine biosynthesis lipoprotein [Nonlabens sp. Hel1_33_55]
MKFYLVLVSLFVILSCKEATQDLSTTTQDIYGNAIGTTYSVKYFSDSTVDLEPKVDSLIDLFNQSMSTWVPDSRINQINAGKDSVAVGPEFKEVFDYAQEIYRKTDGYFDPTVGNLVNAYGFGADGKQEKIPEPYQIDSLLQYVGFYKLDMVPAATPDEFYVASSHSGIYLDFNAIAKGTLVDYIARMLENQGITDYLVEVGGEVTASGINLEKGQDWSVGIDDPTQTAGNRELITAVKLKDKAMAGSGNYRKFKIDEASGQEYVHTVNPLTGKAVPSEVLGVNVIADNCTLADGYATAFMAMPLEKSRRLLANLPEIEVLIMYMGTDGELKFETTPGFNQYVKQPIL